MGESDRDAKFRRADALWGSNRTKQQNEFEKAREKQRQEDAAKTARLRELRLAKEKEEAAIAAKRRKPTHSSRRSVSGLWLTLGGSRRPECLGLPQRRAHNCRCRGRCGL